MCFTYLWWISTDTDLLSNDECVNQSQSKTQGYTTKTQCSLTPLL